MTCVNRCRKLTPHPHNAAGGRTCQGSLRTMQPQFRPRPAPSHPMPIRCSPSAAGPVVVPVPPAHAGLGQPCRQLCMSCSRLLSSIPLGSRLGAGFLGSQCEGLSSSLMWPSREGCRWGFTKSTILGLLWQATSCCLCPHICSR